MEKAAGMIEIHIATLLFGFAGLFGKLVTAPAPVIVFGRTLFAFVVLSGIIGVLKKDFRPRSFRDLAAFFLLGAVLAGHWIAFFHAIQVSTVAVGLFAFSVFPLFVTFMEPVFFKENLRRIDILTAVMVVAGLWCILPNLDPANRITQGVAWGVIAGISFAVLSILNRRYAPTYSPLVIAGYQNGVAAVCLVPVCAFMDFSLTLKEGILLAVLGIFCTAFAHALFIRSLRFIKTQLAGVITGLEPVYGAIFAFLILGERPGIRTLVGGTLIVGAVMIGTLLRASSPSHGT
ncbi:MAG: DMT family transporter [Deltaproteobacteria bacterium]|nr:DMT family transporter [Deltaproteobacteria bacterium]